MDVTPLPRKKPFKWRRALLFILLLAVVGGNGVAWRQAWSMTHYAPSGVARETGVGSWLTGLTVPRPENAHTPADVGLTYTTERIPAGVDEQLEAWVVPAPEARGVVLLFTGYIAAKDTLLAPAVAFHDWGYTTVLVDFRGAGGSSGTVTTLGISEGRDVATAAAWAAARWPGQALILYGFSMGSAAILHAVAHAGVQPAAVILEAPFDRLLNAVRNRFERMGVPASPAAEVLVFWGSVQGGTNGFAHNPADDAAAVHCPALVLRGAVDRNVSDAAAHTVYNALAGRKAYVEVPGADHQLLIGANPTLWKAEVQSFLATVGNAP